MYYRLVVFGVKDTSENVIAYIHQRLSKVDLVITIAPSVTKKNQVSGYKGLSFLTEKYGIPVFEADSYRLTDAKTQKFLRGNTFGIGIVSGWQRLIPEPVLDSFRYGIFGFHGNAGYLPFGRGRSPLNWSMIVGDTRFNLNLFRYDKKADSPNVFATGTFSINEHDDIRTAQYKNTIVSQQLIARLTAALSEAEKSGGEIPIRTDSRDFDCWYPKRTPADGRIDWHDRTRNIYNLIRGVAAPFPGAFCCMRSKELPASAQESSQESAQGSTQQSAGEDLPAALPGTAETASYNRVYNPCSNPADKLGYNPVSVPERCGKNEADEADNGTDARVTIWEAHPFDDRIDFSAFAPGEVIDIFDGKLIVRTVDGSMRIDRFECSRGIVPGDILY